MSSTKLTVLCTSGKENAKTLILSVFTDKNGKVQLGAEGKAFNKSFDGLIEHNIDALPAFEGSLGQTTIFAAPKGSHHQNIVLLGLGQASKLDKHAAEAAGAALYRTLKSQKLDDALLISESHIDLKTEIEKSYAALACAAYEESYEFDKYKTDPSKYSKLKFLNLASKNFTPIYDEFTKAASVAKARVWAKDLGNEPPNVLYPETYANQIQEKLGPLGVKTKVISYEEMQKLGMGAALAVGGSAAHKPCMVVMEYDGTSGLSSEAPVGLVGKGVTFDTGGYSIKTGGSQVGMKYDMCGSAAVVGTMHALAEKKAPVKVAAIVGLVENRIANDAYMVDDIITSMSGKTIEIRNTDAEGRLVLADAMTYLQRYHRPHTMVDVATLTGAVSAALGKNRAGLLTESENLRDSFKNAAQVSGEALDSLPLDNEHRMAMVGKFADLNNSSPVGRMGASTAGGFLSYFVEGDTQWAHLDIAGAATTNNGFATGYGVKLLSEWVEENHSITNSATKTPVVPAPKK